MRVPWPIPHCTPGLVTLQSPAGLVPTARQAGSRVDRRLRGNPHRLRFRWWYLTEDFMYDSYTLITILGETPIRTCQLCCLTGLGKYLGGSHEQQGQAPKLELDEGNT